LLSFSASDLAAAASTPAASSFDWRRALALTSAPSGCAPGRRDDLVAQSDAPAPDRGTWWSPAASAAAIFGEHTS
jgi:hypothetical protein